MAKKGDAPWSSPKKESWDASSILGWFFLTWKDDDEKTGIVNYQGAFAGEHGGGFYVVDFFSWLDGSNTHSKVVHMNEIVDGGWLLFRTTEDRETWLEKYHRRENLRLDREDAESAKHKTEESK